MIKSGPWKASGDDDWNHINSVDVNGLIIIMLIEKRWWANNCFCYPITWSRFSSRQAAEADKGKPQHHRADETIIELHFVRLWIAGSNLETAIENSFLVGWIMKTTQKVGNRRHETTRGRDWIAFVAFKVGFLWSAKGLRIMKDKKELIEVFQWKCAQDMWRPPAKNQISFVSARHSVLSYALRPEISFSEDDLRCKLAEKTLAPAFATCAIFSALIYGFGDRFSDAEARVKCIGQHRRRLLSSAGAAEATFIAAISDTRLEHLQAFVCASNLWTLLSEF